MRKLLLIGLAIALVGCGGKTKEASPEFQALQQIESGLKVRGPVDDYRRNIVEAQTAIDQIEDPQRKAIYNASLIYHKLALDLWQCPDRACEIEQMQLIKDVSEIPIDDPATDDPNIVLNMLWHESSQNLQGLEDEGYR